MLFEFVAINQLCHAVASNEQSLKMNSGAPEVYAVLAPLMAPIVLI